MINLLLTFTSNYNLYCIIDANHISLRVSYIYILMRVIFLFTGEAINTEYRMHVTLSAG